MGDVSNLGMNGREMWLEGVSSLVPGCEAATPRSRYRVASARRSSDQIEIRFASQGASCLPESVLVTLTIVR
jgi:hypothetical protein